MVKWNVKINKVHEKFKTTEKVRILIQYQGNFRSIFWFQVKKDGSFYFGPRYAKITSAMEGSKIIKGNQITLNYDDKTLKKIMNPQHIKGGRMSRHASGVIHGGSGRSFLEPTESIEGPKLEFVILFEHPSKYPIIPQSKIRKADSCINYPLDESRPLVGWLFSSSKEHHKMVVFPDVEGQMNLKFTYSELKIHDMVWQLHLTHSSTGPWPSKTWVIWRSKE